MIDGDIGIPSKNFYIIWRNLMAYINPPEPLPLLLRPFIWLSEKITGKRMLPARILAWYPGAAFSSAVLESLVSHGEGRVTERLLKLVRMQVSIQVSCTFCIDMNSAEFTGHGITDAEIEALQKRRELDRVSSFSRDERLAIRYARAGSSTPLVFSRQLIEECKETFTEREMVILATTFAQVNYWARFIQAVGIPPAGFSSQCSILRLDEYNTLDE
jgi:alkylhydroperoxidase family enzyme